MEGFLLGVNSIGIKQGIDIYDRTTDSVDETLL